MAELSIGEIAREVGGEVVGDPTLPVSGIATLEAAGPADISLVANKKYVSYVGATRAGAVLVSHALADMIPASLTQVRVGDPHAVLGRVIELLHPPEQRVAGIHPAALIGEGVALGEGVSVGPYALVERGCVLGDRVRLGAHAVVGAGARIGADSLLYPHVTLYAGVIVGERCIIHSGARIGTDGFGYAWVDGGHRKIPQIGGCRLEDDVEIGANCTIDRGSIGETVVGRGSKIDNLVHLGHNVRIGAHVIAIAQVGVAGSCTIGDGAVLGGQAGISGHLEIGARARVGAQAGVIGDVPAGETVSGYPARPHREALRAQAALFRLPQLLRRLQRIEELLPRLGRPNGSRDQA